MAAANEDLRNQFLGIKEDIKESVQDIREMVDDTLYSAEAAAIGAGLLAAAILGFGLRHPEISLFLAAELGDIGEELASELGGLTTAVEVGGD